MCTSPLSFYAFFEETGGAGAPTEILLKAKFEYKKITKKQQCKAPTT